MRIVAAVMVIAACGRNPAPVPAPTPPPVAIEPALAPEPEVGFALVPTDDGRTHFARWSDLSIGAAPLAFAATAPRGAQLIVWAARYRQHRIEPGFCPHRIYRFARGGSVPLTLSFDWNPKPGNVYHTYAIELAGDKAAAITVRPDHSCLVSDIGDGADPAAPGTDHVLYYVLGGRDQATGFGPIADGIAINDGGIVIRARFVTPSERAVGFDVTRCEPSPGPR